MIRLEGTITYTDGREERITVTQAEYADFEMWAMRHGIPAQPEAAPPMTMTRYLGYAAAMRAAHLTPDAWRPWEEWGAGVADVTLDVPEDPAAASVPPTPAARLAG